MKIEGYIDIKQTQKKVAELFLDPKNLANYQDTFLRKEVVEGEEGKMGCISLMYYQFGKKEMELKETVTSNKLPDSFEAFYHHKHMDNTMKCTFEVLDEHHTRYHYKYEYVRINWVMPKLMSILSPSMFKKPAEKWLNQFKEFAENQ